MNIQMYIKCSVGIKYNFLKIDILAVLFETNNQQVKASSDLALYDKTTNFHAFVGILNVRATHAK